MSRWQPVVRRWLGRGWRGANLDLFSNYARWKSRKIHPDEDAKHMVGNLFKENFLLFVFVFFLACIVSGKEARKISWLSTAKLMQQSQKINCCASIWIELQKLSALAESLHLRPIARSKSGQHNQTMDRDASLFITSLFTINAFSFYSWQNILCRAPRSRF